MKEGIFTEQLADNIIAIRDVFVRCYALIIDDAANTNCANAEDTGCNAECASFNNMGCSKLRSILIDSGNGGVTPEVLEELGIPYPEKIIITHEHGDHMNGCPNFPEATICISEQGEAELLKIMPNAKTFLLKDGDVIRFNSSNNDTCRECNADNNSNGFELEVISIPGHSKGHIALLEKNRRIIFTGDSIADGSPIYMTIEEKILAEYASSLKKLLARSKDFDSIYTGHGKTVLDASMIPELLDCVDGILNGSIQKTPSPSLLSPGFVYKKERAMIYAGKD